MAKRKRRQEEDPFEIYLRLTDQQRSQPHFGAEWHKDNEAPVSYETSTARLGNFPHDLLYISSYIHDATLRLDRIQRRKTTLVIPLDRCRWELGTKPDLRSIPSQLTIDPVLSEIWEMDGKRLSPEFFAKPELIVSKLNWKEVPMYQYDNDEEIKALYLVGWGFELRLKIRELCKITLTDFVM